MPREPFIIYPSRVGKSQTHLALESPQKAHRPVSKDIIVRRHLPLLLLFLLAIAPFAHPQAATAKPAPPPTS